ncbi:MAG: PIG-L deacetylase family protein [Anaerolineae bacterium]
MTEQSTGATPPMRVMALFAHPDDPEFFAGGTLALWAEAGAELIYVLATSGDKGSSDPDMTSERLIEIREEEQRRAAAVIGCQDVTFLRHCDGELTPSLALRRDLVRMIRLKQPQIVVTNDPTTFWYDHRAINHPDHRAIGEVTLAAVFPTARDRLNYPEMEAEGLGPHKVKQVYLAGASHPNVKVDIAATIERKITALREHKSQILDMEAMAERQRSRIDPESPADHPRIIESFTVITLDR